MWTLLAGACVCLGLPVGSAGTSAAEPQVENQVLFSEDLELAVSAMEEMMTGRQGDWDDLIRLMHSHPERYARLMEEINKRLRRKSGLRNPPAFQGFTAYLHRRTEQSEDFARKSALAWKVGWGLTCADMLPKLRWHGFPSTRRIALEFLKRESHGETFGFDWQPEPKPNDPAILKWAAWIEEHCPNKHQR